MKNYLKLLRIKHWLKNGLVLLPLFFGKSIFNLNKIFFVLIAFIIFSFIYSIVYIINDINDIEALEFAQYKITVPDAVKRVKDIPNIQQTTQRGGDGAFREVVDCLTNS